MKPVEYQNILAVDHLEKGYNYISSKGEEVSCPVLENISFQIEPKEFVGIMGRSGCGKTTLLKVLGMLDKPEKGTVFYKGKDTKEIYGTELAKIRRTELSFIFQDFCLMDSLSIKDNILLPRILDEAEIEESKKICENLTKKFNINKLLNKKPYELSGGEKQRVAICRALINNPQIILADEPTGNLDSNSSEVVMRTLESINGEMGKTILLVTHDPMIASFCKRIIFLKDGQVIENLKRADNKEMEYNTAIIEWLERTADSQDERVRNSSVFILATKYVQMEKYEEANALLKKIPDTVIDATIMKTSVLAHQEGTDTAALFLEGKLLQAVINIQSYLYKLIEMEEETGNHDKAEKIAEITDQMISLFGLWNYGNTVPYLLIAGYRKDVEKCVQLIKQLLSESQKPWNMTQSPLYYRYEDTAQGKAFSGLGKNFVRELYSEIENKKEYEFLRGNKELESIFEEHLK